MLQIVQDGMNGLRGGIVTGIYSVEMITNKLIDGINIPIAGINDVFAHYKVAMMVALKAIAGSITATARFISRIVTIIELPPRTCVIADTPPGWGCSEHPCR